MLVANRILFQDEYCFAIDKPAGHFVHPPERSRFPTPAEKIALYYLRDHFNREVFPVHRLDAPTTGIVLFSFSKAITRELSIEFAERGVEKTYHAIVRGHVSEPGEIALPLEVAGFREPSAALTRYRPLAQIELDAKVGKRYPTARYSYLEVKPVTGRWHQIRRHFDRIAHPLIGDIEHGDSHHNRFFRDELKIPGLCLRAVHLQFTHPVVKTRVSVEAQQDDKWQKLSALFFNKKRDAHS